MLDLNEYPPGEHLMVLLSNGKYATVIVDKFSTEMGDNASHLLVVDSCTYWHVDRHGNAKHRSLDIRVLGVLGPMTCVDDKQPYSQNAVIFSAIACVAFVVLATICHLCKFW